MKYILTLVSVVLLNSLQAQDNPQDDPASETVYAARVPKPTLSGVR
jgi:hypothetical protein